MGGHPHETADTTDVARPEPVELTIPATSKQDDARLRVWRLFLEAHAYVVDHLGTELQAETDLPLGHYDVLVHLSEAPDRRLRMRELANRVLLSKSGLSRLIDRMTRDGLVAREPCDDDRRGTWAVLTARGHDELRRAAPSHLASVDEHFLRHLADGELAPIEAALRRIRDANRPDAARDL